MQAQAEDEVQEAANKEYNEDANAYDHSGVRYDGRGASGVDEAVHTVLLQQMNGTQGVAIMPNLDATQKNIEGADAKGGNQGPNTGDGTTNGPALGTGTNNHDDDAKDDGAFLPSGTPYLTKFYDKLISFGIQSSQVCMLMQNGITSPSKFAIYFDWVALDELLSDKDNGLKVMPKIVQQNLCGLHQWLWTQHLEEVNLLQPDLLNLFNDKEMVTALSEEGKGGAMHEHAGAHKGTKDPQVSYPTFKGDQARWKN